MKTRLFAVIGIVILAVWSRLIPHPWNFTAIGATALFGGAYFQSRSLSLVVPLLALFISDMILGFHPTMVFVYAAFALIVVLGWSLQEKKTAMRLATYSLVTSCVFFLISNFGVWVMEPFYSKDTTGLMACFVAGIPFFANQVMGDLFYVGLLFGTFEYAQRHIPVLVRSTDK
jgi:hypothetical protein